MWFAACLVLATYVAAAQASCAYGTLPGLFKVGEKHGQKWQLLTPKCQLQNYLQIYADEVKPSRPHLPVSIMFLSDSMDRFLMHAFCDTFHGRKRSPGTGGFNICVKEGSTRLIIGQVYVPTFTPQHPVHVPGYALLPGYKQRITKAKQEWTAVFKDEQPDIVVLGGGVWDIQRWMVSNTTFLAPLERKVKGEMEVSDELLQWWMQSLHNVTVFVRELYPHSRLMWRTYAMPQYNGTTGMAMHHALANKQIMVKMRAAGTAVAIEAGMDVVDIEQIVAEFVNPETYLADKHHAKPEIYLEVLNVMLNLALRGVTNGDVD